MLSLDFVPYPELTTPRLLLRALAPEDAPALLRLRSDERVNRYLGRPGATDLSEVQAFMDKIAGIIARQEGMYWAITLTGSTTLIGTICYWNLEREKGIAEIGYELHPDFQGRGIMQEALSAVVAFGFEQMGVEIITAMPTADNEKSIAVLEKHHFKEDAAFLPGEEPQLVAYVRRK